MKWKPIKGYENTYEVSSCGKVKKTKNGKQLQTWKRSGYTTVELWSRGKRKRFLMHRLVADAFLTGKGTQVHHKNHNKEDNRAENLEWSSASDNLVEMWIWGLKRLGYEVIPPNPTIRQ